MESFLFKILVVILSAVFASFIKCLVDSEDKRAFLTRRSCCSSCKKELGFFELVPIFSYLFSKGRCRSCKACIPIDVFLYELFAVISFSVYFICEHYTTFLTFFNVCIFVLLTFLAIEDVKIFELVDEIFYIFLLFNIVFFILNFDIANFISFLFLVVVYHVLYFFTKGGLGYGDIKVFCALALGLDFLEGIYLLIFTFLWAGSFCLILLILKKVDRKSKIALVPFIALAYFSIILLREGYLW